MASPEGGRPRLRESQRRTRALLRQLSDGLSLVDAASAARVNPERVLRLLDEPEFAAVYQAIRAGRLGPVAVVLDAPEAVRPDAA